MSISLKQIMDDLISAASGKGASLIGFFPVGNLLSNTVQTALHELDTNKSENSKFDKSTGHMHTGVDGDSQPIPTNGIKDGSITSDKFNSSAICPASIKLENSRNINGVSFDGTSDINVISFPDVPNYTSYGRKFSLGSSNLQLSISPGINYISPATMSFINNSLSVPVRTTSLICDKLDGTTIGITASYPQIGSQALRYIIDGTSPVSNTGSSGANSISITGSIASVDGRIGYSGKGDASTGYYSASNTIGVPAFNTASTRILVLDQFIGNSAIQTFYNDGITSFGCDSSNNLTINGVNTTFSLVNATSYIIFLTAVAGSTTGTVYINGSPVLTGTYLVNTTATSPTLFCGSSASNKSLSQISYFECYSSVLTTSQIGFISNTLLFPCRYDNNLQGNSISGGDISGYPKEAAFISGTGWESSQTTTGIGGISYIGVNNLTQIATNVSYRNISGITSVKSQYQSMGGSWTDIQTHTVDSHAGDLVSLVIPTYTPSTTIHNFRILANSNTTSGSWGLSELTISPVQKYRTIIDDVVPNNSVSLGIVKTSSTAIIAYDHSSYKYGRREGLLSTSKGNRKVFLGWKSYSGQQPLAWDNPFGTRKIEEPHYVWASDANGTNESDVVSYVSNSGFYGILKASTTTSRISCITQSLGAAYFNSAWQTSGYIGCYIEVIE